MKILYGNLKRHGIEVGLRTKKGIVYLKNDGIEVTLPDTIQNRLNLINDAKQYKSHIKNWETQLESLPTTQRG